MVFFFFFPSLFLRNIFYIFRGGVGWGEEVRCPPEPPGDTTPLGRAASNNPAALPEVGGEAGRAFPHGGRRRQPGLLGPARPGLERPEGPAPPARLQPRPARPRRHAAGAPCRPGKAPPQPRGAPVRVGRSPSPSPRGARRAAGARTAAPLPPPPQRRYRPHASPRRLPLPQAPPCWGHPGPQRRGRTDTVTGRGSKGE